MPASTTGMPRALAFSMMAERFALMDATVCPLRPSLAPSATIIQSMRCRKTQSSRVRPPAVVSPLTPAFTTRWGYPASRRRFCSTDGKLSSRAIPVPAARESPSTRITGAWRFAGSTRGARPNASGVGGVPSLEILPGASAAGARAPLSSVGALRSQACSPGRSQRHASSNAPRHSLRRRAWFFIGHGFSTGMVFQQAWFFNRHGFSSDTALDDHPWRRTKVSEKSIRARTPSRGMAL